MPVIKTFEEHRQYLHDMARLMLWFAWDWQRKHPEESFQSILRDRVDIYRKTDINKETMNPSKKINFDVPEWLEIEQRLAGLREKHLHAGDGPQFEKEAFAVVQPAIDARARRDFEERPYVLDYQCGSLKYDPPAKDNPRRVAFHIANAVAPNSIFDDKNYLPACFLDLMAKSEKEHGADSLVTSTWLNSYAKWLDIFPPEWLANLGPEDRNVQWHFAFWGQFINARGTFNGRLGQRLRDTGEFPFWPRASWCSFKTLRAHFSGLSI